MCLDLPLRCRCGHVRGVASGVSPPAVSGSSATARIVRHSRLTLIGRTCSRRRRHGHFSAAAGRVKLTAGADAVLPALFGQGLPLVRRLLPDTDCQHRGHASFPGSWSHSFLHKRCGWRAIRRDKVLGPVLCRIHERSATAPFRRTRRRRLRSGSSPAAHPSARLVGARARRPSPFFDERTKAPLAAPRVLTASERAAL